MNKKCETIGCDGKGSTRWWVKRDKFYSSHTLTQHCPNLKEAEVVDLAADKLCAEELTADLCGELANALTENVS
jgi:hypothetical protein